MWMVSKHVGSAAPAYEIIELAYIHCALKENFSVTLTRKGFTCFSPRAIMALGFTDLSRITCALGRNHKHSATDKVH